METLQHLEETLICKDASLLPDTYKDDIDTTMLHHEFALFKEPVANVEDAVSILQQMNPVSNNVP